jgi:hypothetical protein
VTKNIFYNLPAPPCPGEALSRGTLVNTIPFEAAFYIVFKIKNGKC